MKERVSWLDALWFQVNHQLKSMFEDFGKTNMYTKRKSFVIGVSSVCYLFPVLALESTAAKLSGDNTNLRLLQLLFCVQTFLSFYSDYWTTGINHISHGIDRWFATSMTVLMTFMGVHFVSTGTMLLLLPPLLCFFNSKLAVKKRAFGSYIFYHTLWHIVGGSMCAYVCYLVAQTQTGVSFLQGR
jgi:hypothetical protein